MATDTTSATEVGSYFISNYPPYSVWNREFTLEIFRALEQEPDSDVPVGLYMHIPFCRKRCKFCYFRVYTNQNAQNIENYVQSLTQEFEMLSRQPGVKGRTLDFAYFGGIFLEQLTLQLTRLNLLGIAQTNAEALYQD